MPDFCTVTGFVYTPSGAPVASTPVRFERGGWAGVSTGAVLPAVATATTNGSGFLSVTLNPGDYRVTVGNNPKPFAAVVPDAASAGLQTILTV